MNTLALHDVSILAPVFALAVWTFLVLTLIPVTRFRAGFKREIRTDDFKFGESASVPDYVRLPNRNYMNLLELPQLFYVLCVMFYVTNTANSTVVNMAWLFVALRVIHSVVHLTYNNVMHRLVAFAASIFVLVALFFMAATAIFR
jgi:hypothetical protein